MSAKFEISADAGNTLKVIQQMTGAFDDTGKAAEGAATATKKLAADAQRIKESIDPQEKLNRKYDEMRQMLAAGLITQGQMIAKSIQLRQEMYAASAEGKAAAAAEIQATKAKEQAAIEATAAAKKRANDQARSLQNIADGLKRQAAAQKAADDAAAAGAAKVKKEREAAAAQLEREKQQISDAAQKVREWLDPQEKLNAKYRELGQYVKAGVMTMDEATRAGVKYRRELMGVSEEHKKAFGGEAIAEVSAMVTRYASAAAAVGLIVSGLKEKRAEEDRAAQRAIQARNGLGSLAQLAAGESTKEAAQKKYAALVSEARGMYAEGATESEGEAGSLLFEMVSADLGRADRDFATQLRAKGVLQNIGGAAGGFDALKTELGGGEVGNFRQFMSKSLEAAKLAPGSFEQLPTAAARSGGSAKELGVSDEFLLAATAIVGKARNSTDEGGTQVAAFLKQAEQIKGAKGIGGTALVEMIASMPEAKQGFGGVLGDRAEAIQGFRVLRDNLPQLRELEASISKAQSSDLAGMAVGLPDTDDQGFAARTAFKAGKRRELAGNEALSADRNLTNSIREDRQEMLLREGRTGTAALDRNLTPWLDMVPGFNSLEQSTAADKKYLSDETRELMRRQTEALERIDRRVGGRVSTIQE